MRAIRLIFLTVSASLFAATSEVTLEKDYSEKVLPHFAKSQTETFRGRGGVKLAFKRFIAPDSKGSIVFVSGWTEHLLKYAELFFNLNEAGYSVFVIDHRGQGFSDRLTDNPQMVHVESYDDYVTDLKLFVDRFVKPVTGNQKLFMLSHSMGGLIAARYLALHPKDFAGAIYSAPLFQTNTGRIPEGVAYSIARAAILTGGAKKYILTHGDTTIEASSDFAKQSATHSKARFSKKVEAWKQNPRLLMSGSSNRWLERTLETSWWLRKGALDGSRVPMLIFQAGQDERVVNPTQDAVCRQVRYCELYRYENSYHEILLEQDEIRNDALKRTLSFIASQN